VHQNAAAASAAAAIVLNPIVLTMIFLLAFGFSDETDAQLSRGRFLKKQTARKRLLRNACQSIVPN
jgi:hypothetical protein